jgi:plasmid stabilization system protein ParE
MRYRIVPLNLALQDIQEIKKHLNQFYPSTPKRFTSELSRQLGILRDMPRIGEVYYARPEYRRVFAYNYAVFYKVDEKDHIVRLYRVLHGSMDFEGYL